MNRLIKDQKQFRSAVRVSVNRRAKAMIMQLCLRAKGKTFRDEIEQELWDTDSVDRYVEEEWKGEK